MDCRRASLMESLLLEEDMNKLFGSPGSIDYVVTNTTIG